MEYRYIVTKTKETRHLNFRNFGIQLLSRRFTRFLPHGRGWMDADAGRGCHAATGGHLSQTIDSDAGHCRMLSPQEHRVLGHTPRLYQDVHNCAAPPRNSNRALKLPLELGSCTEDAWFGFIWFGLVCFQSGGADKGKGCDLHEHTA